jgi:thiol-disulfide isomerase/thioredoxin
MRKLNRLVILAPVIGALVCGCGDAAGRPLPNDPVEPIPVDVREATYDDLDAAVKERKGKVVLVDFWATWCPPCREYFPDHVERHQKYAPHGLVCMSVSLNRLWPRGDYSKEPVLEFLKEKKATFPNFVAMNGEEKIARRFGLPEHIPFTVLFGKTGKKVWDSEQKSLSDRALDRLIESELVK